MNVDKKGHRQKICRSTWTEPARDEGFVDRFRARPPVTLAHTSVV
jgi:hypothetical protein